MRRIAFGLVVAALAGAAAGSAAAAQPRLQIVTRTPLVVAGTHFRAGERVRLMVGGSTFTVRVNRLGAFQANLGKPLADRCSPTVTALGLSGESVTVRLPVRTMCAPAGPAVATGTAP